MKNYLRYYKQYRVRVLIDRVDFIIIKVRLRSRFLYEDCFVKYGYWKKDWSRIDDNSLRDLLKIYG